MNVHGMGPTESGATVRMANPLHEALAEYVGVADAPERGLSERCRLKELTIDPAEIAQAPQEILPLDHPLRHEAKTVSEALIAATAGKPIAPHLQAMQQISRHSSLFPWRRAVAAIAAFHAGDDLQVERHLSGIDDNGPVGVIATALRAMIGKTKWPSENYTRKTTEAFQTLQAKVLGAQTSLIALLTSHLERCHQRKDIPFKPWKTACRQLGGYSRALLHRFLRACLSIRSRPLSSSASATPI